MKLKEVLIRLGTNISAESLKILTEELDRIGREADEPWKTLLLDVFADFIEQHGEQGILLARTWVDHLWEEEIDLKPLNLRTASQVLANAQIREKQNKHKVRQFAVDLALQLLPLLGLLF